MTSTAKSTKAAAVNMEKLLMDLVDPSDNSEALVEQVYALFKPVLATATSTSVSRSAAASSNSTTSSSNSKKPTKTSTKNALKDLGVQLGPLAMKLLNQNVKTLSNYATAQQQQQTQQTQQSNITTDDAASSDGSRTPTEKASPSSSKVKPTSRKVSATSKKSSPPSASTCTPQECIAKTSHYAISVLEILESQLNVKPLDIERAASNIITRLIDARMFSYALKELLRLQKRLIAYIDKKTPKIDDNSENKPPVKQASTLTSSTASSRAKATSKKSTSTTSKTEVNKSPDKSKSVFPTEVFSFTVEKGWADLPSTLLVVASQYNALRCCLESLAVKSIPNLHELLSDDHGYLAWCHHLKTVDSKSASRQYDSLFRLLMKATTKYASVLSPAAVLELKRVAIRAYINVDSVNFDLLHDQILRAAISFEKSPGSQDSSQIFDGLLSFYRNMVALVDTFPNTETDPTKHLAWVDHFGFVCKRWKKFDAALEANKLGFTVCRQCLKTKFAKVVLPVLLNQYFDTIANVLSGQISSFELSDYDEDFEFGVRWLRDCTSPPLSSLSKLVKSMDYCKASAIQLLERGEVKGRQSMLTIALDVLGKILEVLEEGILVRLGQLNGTVQIHEKLLSIVVDVNTFLARYHFDASGTCFSAAEPYLVNAIAICTACSYYSGLRWLSSAFYNIGGLLFKSGDHASAVAPILQACQSLQVYLDNLEFGQSEELEETKTLLAKRWEVLATCYSATGRMGDALECLKKALSVLPRKMYSQLQSSRSSVISSGKPCLAAKVIDRYVKSSFAVDSDGEQYVPIEVLLYRDDRDASSWVDEAVPALEYELTCLRAIGSKSNTAPHQYQVIRQLLEYCKPKDNPLQWARLMIEQAKLRRGFGVVGSGASPVAALSTLESVLEVLKSDDTMESVVEGKRNHYLAVTYLYMGICSNEVGTYASKPLKMALSLWKKLLRKVPIYLESSDTFNRETAKELFDDVDGMFEEISILADYFGVLGQSLNRLLSLKLLLRVLSLMDNVDTASKALRLYTDIGYSYLLMGYTGQSGASFVSAKSVLESAPCSPEMQLYWLMGYSYYLCSVGNIEKGQKIFEQAGVLANSDRLQLDKKEKAYLFSVGHFVQSQLSMALGSLADAIEYADKSLRLIGKATGGFVHMVEALDLKNGDSGVKDDYANYSQLSLSDFQMASMQICTQWHTIQRILECFKNLGELCLLRGSAPESEYFYKQGLKMARLVHAPVYISDFLRMLGELEYRRARLEDSSKTLAEAVEVHEFSKPDADGRHITETKMSLGNLDARQDQLEKAFEVYKEAEIILDEFMEKDFISRMERVNFNAETPREKRIFKSPNSRRSSNFFGSMVMGDTKSECFILEYLKSELACRLSETLVRNGNVDEAEKVLALQQDLHRNSTEQAEFLLVSAKVKILKVLEGLSNNAMMESFQDSVFSIPWCSLTCSSSSVKATPSKTNKMRRIPADIIKRTEQAEALLEEAYELCHNLSLPNYVQEASHFSSILNMIKAYTWMLSAESREDMATSTAYYLEMSKALSLRREMVSTARNKSYSVQAKGVVWPRPIESDQSDDLVDMSNMAKFNELYIDILPDNLVVCSMSVDVERDELYFGRYEKGLSPIILRLPLKRQASREGEDDGMGFKDVVQEFESILESSDRTAKSAKDITGRQAKLDWWKEREALDNQLRDLLERVEECWFGGFKGLFGARGLQSGAIDGHVLKAFVSDIRLLLMNSLPRKALTAMKGKTGLDIHSAISEAWLKLGGDPSDQEMEDIVYYLLDSLQANGVPIDYTEIDLEAMGEELKDVIAKHSVDIIYESDDNCAHTVLILDKRLQMLPWESIPSLRQRSVSRLPSLAFLRDRLIQNTDTTIQVTPEQVFYVLNPDGDLVNTQKEFEESFKSLQWHGIIGRSPSETEYEHALTKNSVYLYFGHSGGEQYFKGHKIRQLENCAVSCLMGCSSGRLRDNGDFDPNGIALNYLMAGCPTLVANLWDVTDKDIDRFTKSMLERWGLMGDETTNTTLPNAVQESRDTCKLKYLVGAAPIVYGIPVSVLMVKK